MKRQNFSSGAKWEDIVGYSRAVKVGNVIEVTGTVATDDNNQVVGRNNAYVQTQHVLRKIEKNTETGRRLHERCSENPHVCYRHYTMGRIWPRPW